MHFSNVSSSAYTTLLCKPSLAASMLEAAFFVMGYVVISGWRNKR